MLALPPSNPNEGIGSSEQEVEPISYSPLHAPSRWGTVRHPLIFGSLMAIGLVASVLGGWLWVRARDDAVGEVAMPITQSTGAAPAANFTLTAIDGHRLQLSDLRGKVVLLDFWATWCPPCKAELPDLEALYRQDSVSHNLTVVGVDVEENAGLTQAFARQYNLTFPLLPDPDGKVSDDVYAIRALPTSFVIDRSGNVRYTWVGEQTRGDIEARLARLW